MVKLKTDEQHLETFRRLQDEIFDDYGQISPDEVWACVKDSLAAHEMKPEYDRMKANIDKVLAMQEPPVDLNDNEDCCYHNGFCNALKEIKAILEEGE